MQSYLKKFDGRPGVYYDALEVDKHINNLESCISQAGAKSFIAAIIAFATGVLTGIIVRSQW